MVMPSEIEVLKAEKFISTGDYEQAFPIYLAMAQAGHREAQIFIGWQYQHGLGVTPDENTAGYWFTQAALQHSAEAEFCLARLAAARRDFDGAFRHYSTAADQGYSPALIRLGWIYETGRSVPADRERAMAYYKQAAQAGNVFGKRALALQWMRGHGGMLRRVQGVFLFSWTLLVALYIASTDPHSEKLRD